MSLLGIKPQIEILISKKIKKEISVSFFVKIFFLEVRIVTTYAEQA